LLPMWRRFGIAPALALAFAIGLAPHFLLPKADNLDWTFPWYVGLFGLGMAGAALGYSRSPKHILWKERVPWGSLTALLFGAYLASDRVHFIRHHLPWLRTTWLSDTLIGTATVCLILFCTIHLTHRMLNRRPAILRMLEMPALVRLGTFSYSLYLIHDPLLGLGHALLQTFGVSPVKSFALLLCIGVPLIIFVSYLFHCVFERPFMRRSVLKAIEWETAVESP
jgi:peptidoglycan/LPS O-acetylase OafA/YrhL